MITAFVMSDTQDRNTTAGRVETLLVYGQQNGGKRWQLDPSLAMGSGGLQGHMPEWCSARSVQRPTCTMLDLHGARDERCPRRTMPEMNDVRKVQCPKAAAAGRSRQVRRRRIKDNN
jgi:hypothetical protein